MERERIIASRSICYSISWVSIFFRKLKSSHDLSSSKIKYNDGNKAISLSSQMQKDPSAVRRDEREDNYSDKSHRKPQQQKQSSHSCNASNRGNSKCKVFFNFDYIILKISHKFLLRFCFFCWRNIPDQPYHTNQLIVKSIY